MTDYQRLEWMLDKFYLIDGAWCASFCLSADKDGIRAVIDREIAKKTLDAAPESMRPSRAQAE